MAGIDLYGLGGPRMLAVLYSLAVDEAFNPFEEGREEGRRKVDEWLADAAAQVEDARGDRATWGMLPAHQEGQNAGLTLAAAVGGGGP